MQHNFQTPNLVSTVVFPATAKYFPKVVQDFLQPLWYGRNKLVLCQRYTGGHLCWMLAYDPASGRTLASKVLSGGWRAARQVRRAQQYFEGV